MKEILCQVIKYSLYLLQCIKRTRWYIGMARNRVFWKRELCGVTLWQAALFV